MEYTVEEISPVKKKVSVSIAPAEVEAAIKAAAAMYQAQAELDGFRKGKAPLNVVEKRFHGPIYKEAHDDLINVHINEIMQKLDAMPVSGISMQGEDKPLKKGEGYEYTMEFETLPKFALPAYEALDVEQKRPVPSDQVVDGLLEKLRRDSARIEPVDGSAPGKDGQIVNLDFEIFENGKPVEGLNSENFEIELGKREALPEFEAFVKEIPVGHTAEKEINFPEDFIANDLAGKKLLVKVTVHAVKERKLPEVNEAFLRTYGKESVEDLKASLADAYSKGIERLYTAEAQQKLLEMLVKQTDFQLPVSMVDAEKSFLAVDAFERLARQGKRPYDDDEGAKKFLDTFREPAEKRVREKILLLTIAKKENLEVSQKEVEREVLRGAMKMKVDPKAYYQQMQESGLIFQLRDNLLCDKAMDLVYGRANVKMVDQAPGDIAESLDAPQADAAVAEQTDTSKE